MAPSCDKPDATQSCSGLLTCTYLSADAPSARVFSCLVEASAHPQLCHTATQMTPAPTSQAWPPDTSPTALRHTGSAEQRAHVKLCMSRLLCSCRFVSAEMSVQYSSSRTGVSAAMRSLDVDDLLVGSKRPSATAMMRSSLVPAGESRWCGGSSEVPTRYNC